MQDSKGFFYPAPIEEFLNMKVGSINQEKELEFQQRRNNMERDALREEKLRAEKERGQKFLESEFDFKGEDEEIIMPRINLPDNLKFKSSNKTRVELDQVFSVVEYAKLPENLKDLFNLTKADKPSEEESIEYIDFDKLSQPNLYKYSRKMKMRKTEQNILNLYDVSLKSLLTSAEILKRSEILAKLYMKCHYNEEKYGKELEERKLHQKKTEKSKKDASGEPIKNDSGLLSSGTLLVETQREQKQNLSYTSLPPGAKLIQSENFPPPPPIKLPTQSLFSQSPTPVSLPSPIGVPVIPPIGLKSTTPSTLVGLPPLPRK